MHSTLLLLKHIDEIHYSEEGLQKNNIFSQQVFKENFLLDKTILQSTQTHTWTDTHVHGQTHTKSPIEVGEPMVTGPKDHSQLCRLHNCTNPNPQPFTLHDHGAIWLTLRDTGTYLIPIQELPCNGE